MMLMDRLVEEQRFHDLQADERAEFFQEQVTRLQFEDGQYLDHETWIRPAFEELGDLHGKDALDYGCGHGMAAVVMARRGANVTGFDLSNGYVREARERALANRVAVRFLQANAESLQFPDQSFDVVWGCAILHHLDLDRAGRELHRILRPGGKAVFCEPWGENPILDLARRRLPYPGKHRTPDEHPLRSGDLVPLNRIFPTIKVRGCQLLGMLRRVFFRQPRVGNFLDRWDSVLLRRFPRLEKWCRYVVITVQRG